MKRIIYARILLLIMILQLGSSMPAYALTGGPAQPEFQSFEPVTTTEMVNLPDGGFTYNIPLMDIGGYPLNLSYHSEITADMEASCVGLGWSINPGVINRNIRALPDDFSGDVVTKKYNLKPNSTYGASLAVSYELLGFDAAKNAGKAIKKGVNMGMNMGIFYNSYWGIGYEFGLSPSFSAGSKGGGSLTAGIGLNVNSQSGANFSPSLKYSRTIAEKDKYSNVGLSASVATNISSREGMKAIAFSTNASINTNSYKTENGKEVIAESISTGTSAGGSFNFAGNTFTPEFTMPQNNIAVTVNFKPAGLELFGSNGTAEISGYYSRQGLRNKEISKNSYGLLYAHRGRDNENALLDFNREKDGAFFDYSIHLPIVNPGFDILNVNGQGIGGSFQLKRSDVPVFFDAKSTAESFGGNLGIEIGSGNTAHGGVDIKFNYTNSVSKKWTDKNDVLDNFNFFENASEGYEPAYYKAAGEMAIESDPDYYNFIGKDIAVRADLETHAGSPFNVGTKPQIKDEKGSFHDPKPVRSATYRMNRDPRNEVISYLTSSEASNAGLDKKIKSYPLNTFLNYSPIEYSRITSSRKSHHISQIESNQPGGMRYIYGIPAYNLIQKEVSFSADTLYGFNCLNGTISYIPNKHNTENNDLGQDNYFNSVETPAFAHTYLLTTVLGKDYEDLSGNGPSEDDFGSYTKINYSRVTNGSDSVYHWRVPFGLQQATYNPGFYSKSHDDKGSYIYGQKEIWLVHSIESKTIVAEFYYSARKDGYGVIDEDGGRATYNLNQKLDSIKLYSKSDRQLNTGQATPIKIVHFSYDYSLCPGTENSIAAGGGKLTLTGLYFTYGHSQKGRLSDYAFNYKNKGTKYSSKEYDRWGFFKENNVLPNGSNVCLHPTPGSIITNDEFPYSEQDSSTANKNAGTWSLERIDLPSGGTIKVDYSAKHYAYVQDKPAMQLMKIEGIGTVGQNKLYGTQGALTGYLKVLVKLNSSITTRAQFYDKYLKDIHENQDYLYLKCFVKMNSGFLKEAKYEYVSLYSQISAYGIDGNGYGWVDLKPLPNSDDGKNPTNIVSNTLNPISKYSLQHMRENLPEIAHQMEPVTNNSMPLNLNTFKSLFTMWLPLVELVHGFTNVMIGRGYAREIALDRSYIRLYEPRGFKFGGGSMVRNIKIEDNWGTMTSNPSANFSYGQVYDYRATQLNSEGKTDTISSGVASYEPMIGEDENPWRTAEVVTEERKFAVDNVHYVERPFGEVFMPAPQVVFSKITVRNLKYKKVERTATGYSVMKYYTAKDFPVKMSKTDLQKKPRRIHPILSLLKVKLKEHMNASMGYVVETNNMHGQALSSEVYDEKGTRISGVRYYYKTKAPGELENSVEVIKADGSVDKGLLGVTYQLAGDARESKTKTTSGGVAVNLDVFIIGVYPVTIPVPWPSFESNEERFRSMSFTKLVHKFGVLDRVEAYDLGSTIATENTAYDAETGEVLLTKTYNEFDDPIYNLKMPAHWAYKGMQGAYKNIGFETDITKISTGIFKTTSSSTAVDNFFFPGDEVLLDGTDKAWVLHKNDITDQIYLIDRNGFPINTFSARIKVIRSGYRNMPTSQIGTITSMANPINGGFLQPVQQDSILHAEAVEYGDKWQTFCGPLHNCAEPSGEFPMPDSCYCYGSRLINPYVRNILGEWRPLRSWLYLTDRDRTPLLTSNTNIRENGFYLKFNSFWQRPTAPKVPWRINVRDWIWSAESTLINPHGTELESKNRLGLYSAEILGYYQQLITGVGSNTRYRQLAFEGFEDFAYDAIMSAKLICKIPRHFGKGFDPYVTDVTYHSGKYSILVLSNYTAATTYAIKDNCLVQAVNQFPNGSMGPYQRDECDCIQNFSPDIGKYVITAWVKEGIGLGYRTYNHHEVEVRTNSSTANFKATGMIIEGWERVEGEFEVHPGDQNITVELKATGRDPVYFDDIRIFPFNSNMKNYVYDDISLKLLAELDANGYAKFYEYSQEGELIRIKQETERGIMTIQEYRSSMPK